MADAWANLLVHSSLGSGHDAWEYLNTQSGGELRYVSDKVIAFNQLNSNVMFDISSVSKVFLASTINMNFDKKEKISKFNNDSSDLIFKAQRKL